MISIAKFAKAAPCTKPLLGFASLALMIAFIFSTVIVTAGKQESSKGLYIVSFEYDVPASNNRLVRRQQDDDETTTIVQTRSVATISQTRTVAPEPTEDPAPEEKKETTTPASSPTPTPTPNLKLQEKFKQAVESLIEDDKMNATIQFNHARVSYSGICVEVTSMEGIKGAQWRCGPVNTTEVLGATAGGDPFDLIGVAAFFKDKIAFSLPWWVATVCLGIAMLCQMLLMLPLLPIPPVVQKVTAVLALLGCTALLGGLVLQHVAANTVASLSLKLTMGTVNAHVGRMNQALGWTGFALSLLANIGIWVIVAAEMAIEKGEQMMNHATDAAINKVESKLPYGNPGQNRSFSGSSTASSGLGRSLRDNGPDVLRGLAKAKTRSEALSAVAGGFRNEKTHQPHNMV
ncbi:hypothetical protein TWF569_009111 [Orbilia oligospora]|uniref:Uncharacterized protein n=1 Tax=Orbilia oligospora TaxID=2813651 RepID=A0A7C8N9R8_ORBOL|nr:hypothetical protein TWF102_006260 [Orbilia oligospora]KAF3112641.1 hypothetical protein TWF103_002877 [Orbilia oligospora]KAF3123913.1 hypothetical protein TWF594_002152 [Orbilia oligospora]KAF3137658.1 hypothetical protein TWF569_009111 [Orbilia oligospora]